MFVRWGDATFDVFNVSNGVRQGGILSPFLFNLYMDKLSSRLKNCKVGSMILNHIMYADNLVVFFSYSASMQKILDICSEYGIESDIKYNAIKSNMLIVRSKDDKNVTFPSFYLNGGALNVCSVAKYLGYLFSQDMNDDKDINRQCRKLYAQGNMLVRKFHMCTPEVKINLFRSYITPLYCAHIWCNYKKCSLKKLKVAYNDVMQLLLRVPKFCSAYTDVPACQAIVRNLIHKFICHLEKSENCIIKGLVDPRASAVKCTLIIWCHWCKLLYVHFVS